MHSRFNRWSIGFVAVALVLFVGTAIAQQAAVHDHSATAQAPAEMTAADQKLDELVASMNAARGGDRLDAVVAVVNQLVDAHKKMRAHMESMHGGMMMGEHAGQPAEK